MRRYVTDQELKLGKTLNIEGELFHHIHKVCRQDVGHHFELLNPKQSEAFLCEVVGVTKKSLHLSLTESRPLPRLEPPYIHLVLSFPKPKVFESVVEKAVELGVYKIHPVLSDYSFLKNPAKLQEKQKRWTKIVQSAMGQSARFQQMEIASPESLKVFLKGLSNKKSEKDLILSFYEGQAQSLDSFFKSWKANSPHQGIENIWVLIGSEGGFSKQEVELFQELGIPALSLGEQVLRVETACVSIVSVLRYICGSLGLSPSDLDSSL